MAHTLKTREDGDIVRRALAILHNKLKFIKTINRQYDNRFAVAGAKNSGTLLIRNPNQFTVRTGATMDTNDITEETQTLTVATQKGVDLPSFTSEEMTMDIDDFEARYLEPAMARLAAEVESDVMSNVYKDIYNQSGTGGTEPDAFVDVVNANIKISQGLAPETNRNLIMDSVTMGPLVDAVKALFHKGSEISRAFTEGFIGQAAGLKWFESNMTPTHTNGSRTDTTPVCNTSTGITSGSSSIVTTGATNAKTLLKGDIFTIADVYAVNPETKQRYAHLQQWVNTADKTQDTTDTFVVSPTPVTSGAKQNCEIVSAGAGKAILNLTGGGSGDADGVFIQPLAYHRDAFTFVSADLHMEPTQRMSRAVMDGISMRFWRGADIVNDKFPARLDILYGFKTLRPEWAVRMRGT